MPTSGPVCVTVNEVSVRVFVAVLPDVHSVSVSVSVVVVSTTVAVCF